MKNVIRLNESDLHRLVECILHCLDKMEKKEEYFATIGVNLQLNFLLPLPLNCDKDDEDGIRSLISNNADVLIEKYKEDILATFWNFLCIYKVVKNNKMKKILSESTLLCLLENCVQRVMEGLGPQGYDGHIFSAQELKSMYENQNGLDEVQQKALNAAMWVRARNANYHGYSEDWPNIMYKGGKYFYWENGQLLKVPYRE